MKKYDIYGIGNALLDLDFEVSVETLNRLNIDKGVMTLIDENKHHFLLEELDSVKHLKACGGSSANTIFAMQQLGSRTYYSFKIGDDAAGEFFYQNIINEGIHTNLNDYPREGITGKCIVLVTPDADRTMNTFLGATSNFSVEQLSYNAIVNSEYLYIEGYLVAQATGQIAAIEAHQHAKAHGIKTAISLSDPNMVTYFKEGLLKIIGDQVDILFCNEDEALLFTKTESLSHAREELKKYAKSFVVTLGAKGALVYDGDAFALVPPYKTKVVDTVGAGDIFAGVFLHAITEGHDYVSAADFANYAASKVVSKYGPRLNNNEMNEIQSFLLNKIAAI